MPSSARDPDATGGIAFFLTHPEREVGVAHYFRQITITRRRLAPWLNRLWCRNRGFAPKGAPWKH